MFSVYAVCESCIEPIPACSHGEILAVDLNTTNSCCPQYHCGKLCVSMCTCLCVCFVSSKSHLCFFPCVAVCDVNLCPESSVSCAPGLSLIQTNVPGHCCPQHHCGTHTLTHTHTHEHTIKTYSIFYCHIELIIEAVSHVFMPVTYLNKLHATSLFNFLSLSLPECQCEDSSSPVCQVVSQQKAASQVTV